MQNYGVNLMLKAGSSSGDIEFYEFRYGGSPASFLKQILKI